MTYLKQEMRELFEKHSAMEFNERNSRLEEGLLEKIINLAFANLCPYSGREWQIIAIRNPIMIQKLYRLLNDKRILDSSVALLVTAPCSSRESGSIDGDIGLLSLSLACSAKYYCIGSFFTRSLDNDALVREFSLKTQGPIVTVAGLGIFHEIPGPQPIHKRYVYSDIVREL